LSLAEDQFESFVLSGGVVQYNTATIGVSVSLAGTGVVLPGSAEPSNAVVMPAHPIVAGLGPLISADFVNLGWISDLPPGANVITRTKNSGKPTTAEYRYGGTVIVTTIACEHLYEGGLPAGDILHNAMAYALSAASVSWVTVSPEEGTVMPGDVAELAVMFDSQRRPGGDYRAILDVQSDDPAHPSVAIPVAMHVMAAPDIASRVSGAFHPRYVGETETIVLEVSNVGAELLAVSGVSVDQPDFVVSPDAFSLAPGQQKLLPLSFAPTRAGTIGATLTIASNDPDEGSLEILLSGFGLQPAPVISLSPSGLLVFDNVPYGGKADRVVRVSNSGIGPLTVSDITSDHPEYTVDVRDFVVPAGSSRDVVVTFAPPATGVVIGMLTFTSNDTDHGPVSLQVAGVGVEPPAIELSADALIDTLAHTGTSARALTIRNTGLGELSFNVHARETAPTPVAGAAGKFASARSAARLGRGGPDAYGYRWRDSNDAAGPAYEWISVQDGTNVGVGSDGFVADIPLGFEFEYYGGKHSAIGASANGWLGFGDAAVGYPAQVPFADDFDGVIAPMARDLLAAQYVRYKTVGIAPHRQFVIEYNGIWNGDNTPIGTFEVILFETTNAIRFQYLSVGVAPLGFGIESPDESTGLGNSAPGGLLDPALVQDGYAIEFSNVPVWLRVEPSAATVPPGGTAELTVTLDAAGLEEGSYSANLIVANNDPARSEVVVPVTLLVSDKLMPVLITRFEASVSGDVVNLRWELSADEEILGFRIYRADARGNAPVDITSQAMLRADARSYRDDGAQRGNSYRYQLAVVGQDREIVSSLVRVELAPYRLALEQNHPNPFNPSTTISFTLAERSRVVLAIFDVSGRPARTLFDGTLEPGRHQYPWNGQNARGEVATSGVYFCRLTSGKQTLTRKMVLLK
ncbi:MAG TPA: choice-of-anchor D domain-containing protein, partial [Candidatus Krumholzibacteria bacterium]